MSKFNVGDRVVLSKKSAVDNGVPKQLSLDTVYTVESVEIGHQSSFLHVKSDSGDVSGRWLEERFEMANIEEYIIWSPGSDKPPTVRFLSREAATDVARKLVAKNIGECFYVCRLAVLVKVSDPDVKVLDL